MTYGLHLPLVVAAFCYRLGCRGVRHFYRDRMIRSVPMYACETCQHRRHFSEETVQERAAFVPAARRHGRVAERRQDLTRRYARAL